MPSISQLRSVQERKRSAFHGRLRRCLFEGLESRWMLASDLLLADPTTDSVLQFDAETGDELGTFVPSGSGGLNAPQAPTFGPDGDLYVISQSPAQVLKFDGETGDFDSTFVVAGEGGFNGGSDLAFGPSGDLYVATNSSAGILRFDGLTGSFEASLALPGNTQRAISLDFGPDGLLYVLDVDSSINTLADRILRFDVGTNTFVDQFVNPGLLDDASSLRFGPDLAIYVTDVSLGETRRFDGSTGSFLGIASSNQPVSFAADFGPNGNLYAASPDGIEVLDGESYEFVADIISGTSGTFTFFPTGPASDLQVTSVSIDSAALIGTDQFINVEYTVANNSTEPTAADNWVDVIYLSQDMVLDSYDLELARIPRAGRLSATASYTEDLAILTPNVVPGEYYALVVADRRGNIPDSDRANNFLIADSLTHIIPQAFDLSVDNPLAVGRTASAWTTTDVTNQELTITYSVHNLTTEYLTDVTLAAPLATGVQLVSASGNPQVSGQTLTWDVTELGPLETAAFEVQISLADASVTSLDEGATATGFLNFSEEYVDAANPIELRTDTIDSQYLASTIDANWEDPFIQAKAAELNQDPDEIFAFVNEQVAYESYLGSLRGARGAMWSQAANSLDQSSLLIGLLRYSGIPARYVEGTLETGVAQDLILSMFPDPLRVISFVPDEAERSQPQNDPALLAETQRHYWVQFDAGDGFIDADPTVPGAVLGESFAVSESLFAEIDTSLRYEVNIALDREIANTASSLFGGGASLNRKSVLSLTYSSVELVGRPVTFGQVVDRSVAVTPITTTVFDTYQPFAAIGDYAQPVEEDLILVGESYQELITSFPFGTLVFTGLFVTIETVAPDGTQAFEERTLFDRLGFDVRQGGGSPELTIDPTGPTALTVNDVFTVSINSGALRADIPTAVADELAHLQQSAQVPPTDLGTVPESFGSLAWQISSAASRLLTTNYQVIADFDLAETSSLYLVKAYITEPQILISTVDIDALASGTEAEVEVRLDLRSTPLRIIAAPSQNIDVESTFRFIRGIRESELESIVAASLLAEGSRPAESTAEIFALADQQGIAPIVISSGNLNQLDALDISNEAKARITAAVTEDQAVIVPSQSVEFDGRQAIAWYEVDTTSGRAIGVTEDGGHQAIVEYANALVISAELSFLQSTLIILGNYLFNPDCQAGSERRSFCKDVTNGASSVGNHISALQATGDTLLALLTVGNFVLPAFKFLAGWAAGNQASGLLIPANIDPPAPDYLLSPQTPLEELNDFPDDSTAIQIVEDPLLTLPRQGAEVPTVFRAGIQNGVDETAIFELDVSDVPAGFVAITSTDTLTVPAGAIGEVGFALDPNGPLPLPGTPVSFSVTANDLNDPANQASSIVDFVVPEIHGLAITASPTEQGAIPGSTIETIFNYEALGNVDETVNLSASLPEGLTIDGLDTLVVGQGSQVEQTLSLIVADSVPLNTTLIAEIQIDYGNELPTTLVLSVVVAAPGAAAVVNAATAAAALNQTDLAPRLLDLSAALNNLTESPDDEVFRDQALANLDSIVTLLQVDPILVDFAAPLREARQGLADADTTQAVQQAIVALGEVLNDFDTTITTLSASNFEVFLAPNSQIAQPQVAQPFTLTIQNIGTETTTYDVALSDLPADLTAQLNTTSVTLSPGSVTTVDLSLTSTSVEVIQAADFSVKVSIRDSSPEISRLALGTLSARREFLSVTSVTATPQFVQPGESVPISAQLLNTVNRPQDVEVSFEVFDASGSLAATSPSTESVRLDVQNTLVFVDFDPFDTTGLSEGLYRIEVSVREPGGSLIPGGVGVGELFVGSPVVANVNSTPQILPPGNSTATNQVQLNAQSLISTNSSLNPLGQLGIAGGSRGVGVRAANGVTYVYTCGPNGIQVVDATDAASPVVLSTIPGNHTGCRVQDNVLLALAPRAGGFVLDVYALQDTPESPPLIGSSAPINYELQTDLQSNSTHAFVSQFQVCLFLSNDDVFHQSGDLLAIELNLDDSVNPSSASPLLVDVLSDTFGDTSFDPTDFSGCPENGGDHLVWNLEVVDSSTVLAATTTVAGGDTQSGVGVIQVVDVSDAANPSVERELEIPGTTHAVGVGVQGSSGVVIGSTGGYADPFTGLLTGNLTVTTLDMTDPRDPQIVTTEVLDRLSSTFWANTATLGEGIVAFSNLGFEAEEGNPQILVIDASNPAAPIVSATDIPVELTAPNAMFASDDKLYVTETTGLTIYEIEPVSGLAVTATVEVPNSGVSIVPGSFNVEPTDVVVGADSTTITWDLQLGSSQADLVLSWESQITDLQPGETRDVTNGTIISLPQSSNVEPLSLASTNVFARQVLSLTPDVQTIVPGDSATYLVTLLNPSASTQTYDLSLSGLPSDWVELPSQVEVAPDGVEVVTITVTSDPFAPTVRSDFVLSASTARFETSVGASLILEGTPVLPDPVPEAIGVVTTLAPTNAEVGRGGEAFFTSRVTNTGTSADSYVLFTTGLPPEFVTTSSAGIFTVAPGASNFLDVDFSIQLPADAPAGDYPFTLVVASTQNVPLTSEAQGLLTVSESGVVVSLIPDVDDAGLIWITVTNTGTLEDTFQLSLAAAGATAAMLEDDSLSLLPGESAQVRINVEQDNFLVPGSIPLAGLATSQNSPNVQDADQIELLIEPRLGLAAEFLTPEQSLPGPGDVQLGLRIDNTGNEHDEFIARIIDVSGPLDVALLDVDGNRVDQLPVFVLPGQTGGLFVVDADVFAVGTGSVTVEVVSLSDESIRAEATASVTAESTAVLSLETDPVSPITENGLAELAGTIVRDSSAPLELRITWGDPQSPSNEQTFQLGEDTLNDQSDGIDWDPVSGRFVVSHRYLDDNPSDTPSDAYAISVELANGTNQILASSSESIVVNNSAPEIVDLDRSTDRERRTVHLTGRFEDLGSLDSHRLLVDWGDGSTSDIEIAENADTFEASHEYTTGGIFEIQVTISDDDLGTDAVRTTTKVTGVRLDSSGDLEIVGTNRRDVIWIKKVWDYERHEHVMQVVAYFGVRYGFGCYKFAKANRFTFDIDQVRSITGHLFSGHDKLVVGLHESHFHIPTKIDAGPGNDILFGGGAADVMHGGRGRDFLFGRSGNDLIEGDAGADVIYAGSGGDIILGGDGNDKLFGGSGGDIVVGGYGRDWLEGDDYRDVLVGGVVTADRDTLRSASAAWRGADTYSDRVQELSEQWLVAGSNVFDDGRRDYLRGEQGRDLFYARVDGGKKDKLLDRRSNETVIPLETLPPADSHSAVHSSRDVNRDGHITPLDALLLINWLNGRSGEGEQAAGGEGSSTLDVDGNGDVTPLDALLVVNQLNDGQESDGIDEAAILAAPVDWTGIDSLLAEDEKRDNLHQTLEELLP